MIAFEGCPMGNYMNERTTRKLLYVATISPNEEKEAPQSFLHVPVTALPMDSDDGLKPSAPTQYSAKYPYLSPATEYIVRHFFINHSVYDNGQAALVFLFGSFLY